MGKTQHNWTWQITKSLSTAVVRVETGAASNAEIQYCLEIN